MKFIKYILSFSVVLSFFGCAKEEVKITDTEIGHSRIVYFPSIETKGEKIAELVREYSWVTAPLEAIKFGILGVDASIKAEETVKKLAQAKPKAGVNELKNRIEQLLSESDKKIVIIMDDIDNMTHVLENTHT